MKRNRTSAIVDLDDLEDMICRTAHMTALVKLVLNEITTTSSDGLNAFRTGDADAAA